LWLLLPVLLALWVSDGKPCVLAYAPLFGHFVGGQSSVFGLLGLWGYRRHVDVDDAAGGVYLGVMLLKPQLGIVPLAYAAVRWWQAIRADKRVPRQTLAWLGTMGVLYLPSFFMMPDWPLRWLGSLRPLFERAMSAFVPRTLLLFFDAPGTAYWSLLLVIAVLTFIGLRKFNRGVMSLELLVLWGFLVNPLMHDYDLIQLIPLMEKRADRLAALLLSIPGWVVIFLAYDNDAAWYAFAWIALGLLGVQFVSERRCQGFGGAQA